MMSGIPTYQQVSAGGVAFRQQDARIEVVLISVGAGRWQLPKGIVDEGESQEQAAQREVREETGIETDLIRLIDTVEYWYYAMRSGQRVRYHKFVHFYLLRYAGDSARVPDQEAIQEVRWVPVSAAESRLTFQTERQVMHQAEAMLKELFST